jgi:hypothetical protein
LQAINNAMKAIAGKTTVFDNLIIFIIRECKVFSTI